MPVPRHSQLAVMSLLLPLALTPRLAGAQVTPLPQVAVAAPAPAPKGPTYTVNGYVEAYTYSFENPSNGIVNYRGFDDRHNTFTIQNAVIDASGSIVGLSARIALQVGHRRRQGPGVGGGHLPVAIGPEAMAAKDAWNYSRSNLFFGLPFYHTGVRATLHATDRISLAFWLVNGWNSVVDNNSGKSLLSSVNYKIPDRLLFQVLYMGGPERPTGAPEGQCAWQAQTDRRCKSKPGALMEGTRHR